MQDDIANALHEILVNSLDGKFDEATSSIYFDRHKVTYCSKQTFQCELDALTAINTVVNQQEEEEFPLENSLIKTEFNSHRIDKSVGRIKFEGSFQVELESGRFELKFNTEVSVSNDHELTLHSSIVMAIESKVLATAKA